MDWKAVAEKVIQDDQNKWDRGVSGKELRISTSGTVLCSARPNTKLRPRLPRFRKPWMSEDYRMSIFDAVRLGITYFH
jgi:hypothetical protein